MVPVPFVTVVLGSGHSRGQRENITGDLSACHTHTVIIIIHIIIWCGGIRIDIHCAGISKGRRYFYTVAAGGQSTEQVCAACASEHASRRVVGCPENSIRTHIDLGAVAGIQLDGCACKQGVACIKGAVVVHIHEYQISKFNSIEAKVHGRFA